MDKECSISQLQDLAASSSLQFCEGYLSHYTPVNHSFVAISPITN